VLQTDKALHVCTHALHHISKPEKVCTESREVMEKLRATQTQLQTKFSFVRTRIFDPVK